MSFRKEKKFRLSTSDMLKLKNDLFKTGMTTLHKPRKVNSCYFDTQHLTLYHESEEGVLPRKKIRIRWYNNDRKFSKETKISSIEGRYKFSKKSSFITSIKELKNLKLDIVIHAAALVDVDVCEKNPKVAYNENVLSTSNLLQCIDKSTKLIFISTIAVYPNGKGPHLENNTGPVNYYGKTKLLCEKEVREHEKHLILRTVFFGFSKNKKRTTLCDHLLLSLQFHLKYHFRYLNYFPHLIYYLLHIFYQQFQKTSFSRFQLLQKKYLI